MQRHTFALARLSAVSLRSIVTGSAASPGIRRRQQLLSPSVAVCAAPRNYGVINTSSPYFSALQHRLFSEVVDPGARDVDKKAARPTVNRRRAQLRRRRKASKKVSLQKVLENIRMHKRQDIEIFFDRLATDHSLNKIEKVRKLLDEKVLDVVAKNTTRDRKEEDDVVPAALLLTMFNSTNTNSQPKLTILEFILSVKRNKPKAPPRGKQTQENALILQRAREKGLEHLLSWGSKDAREIDAMSEDQRLNLLTERNLLHSKKSKSSLRSEATELVDFLDDHLPPKTFLQTMELFQDFYRSDGPLCSESDRVASSFVGVRLSGQLKRKIGSVHHVVAQMIAEFFYMDHGTNYNVVDTDEHVMDSRKEWSLARSDFVETVAKVESLIGEDGEVDADDVDDELELEDDTKPEDSKSLIDKELAKLPASFSKRDLRFRRPVHKRFDALVLDSGYHQERGPNESDEARRTVFVDNLPIDITDEYLKELYSRLGSIESTEIFNQRPDLDPGPLNQASLIRRRKKRRLAVKNRRWSRPRTPVYAKLTFKDQSACEKALDASLRIFGMIIDRHPARSIPSFDMTRLYLENLPPNIPCLVSCSVHQTGGER